MDVIDKKLYLNHKKQDYQIAVYFKNNSKFIII